jgi:hypothetical protein
LSVQYSALLRFLVTFVVLLLLASVLPSVARAADDEELGFERPGDLIAVKANASEVVAVEKVGVRECRLGRAPTIAPIDGRRDTFPDDGGRRYAMGVWGNGGPSYNTETGVHIWLADRQGFNLVRVEGGYQGLLFRDVASWGATGRPWWTAASESEEERQRRRLLVAEVRSEGAFFRKLLPVAAVTRSVSFFGGSERRLAEAGFYRVGAPNKPYRAAEEWWLAAEAGNPAAGGAVVAPFLAARFGPADRGVVGTMRTAPPTPGSVPLPGGAFVHVLVGPLALEEGLTAVELDLQVEGIRSRCPLTVRVQDPLNGRQELMAADVALSGPGHARLILDFPNQVLPVGAYLWVSVAARDGGRIVTGKEGSRLRLLAVARDSALGEALEYRKLMLRGYLLRLGEEFLRGEMPRAQRASTAQPAREADDAMGELFATLEQCRWLAPDDAEVVEYGRRMGVRWPDPPWMRQATSPFRWPPAGGPGAGA